MLYAFTSGKERVAFRFEDVIFAHANETGESLIVLRNGFRLTVTPEQAQKFIKAWAVWEESK